MTRLGWYAAVALSASPGIVGCCRVPVVPPCPQCEPVKACLVSPPPKATPVELVVKDCPPSYVGCLTVDGGLALEKNIRESRLWQQEAWLRCGPLPTPPVTTPPPK